MSDAYEGPNLNAKTSAAAAARGSYATAFYDSLQNAMAAPTNKPLIEFGLLARVAEELRQKSGLIESDPRELSRESQQAYGELREVYREATLTFDGRDGMRRHLRVVAWAALAEIGDPTETSERLRAAAENEAVKADAETARAASDYIGQPLADFIGDCLNVSDQLDDWERVARRRPRRADILTRLRGGYVPPAEREKQPPKPPEPDAPNDKHPEIG